MRASLFTIAGAVPALAAVQGFNYASTDADGAAMTEQSFSSAFAAAKQLVGAAGFTSARLYTMIDAGPAGGPISAVPAAISSKTSLLLGMWASGTGFDDELAALNDTILQYGNSLSDLVVGISVGSEDLYRNSPIGAGSNPGQQPDVLVEYMKSVKSLIAGTPLASVPVGHVDTWTAWVNGSNDAVIAECGFVGMDAYPYFQSTESNDISSAKDLFVTALGVTTNAAGDIPVWVTETGWPVSGPTANLAVPSLANAQTYWDKVGCDLLFGETNVWWYTLEDAPQPSTSPSFGIVGSEWSTTPLYNLTCSAGSTGGNAQSSASTSIFSSSVAPVSSATALQASAHGSGVVLSAVPTVTGPSATGATISAVTGSTTSIVGGQTLTIWHSTLVTITSCSSSCTTLATQTAATASASASPSTCPQDLNGDYLFPHLIVPVSSTSPNTAFGTQYNATINSTTSTIFNFDIPESYANKTCSLLFLFPLQSQLETSAYAFNGQGGLVSQVLASPVDTTVTYNTLPGVFVTSGSITSLQEGTTNTFSNDNCPAGEKVSFEVSSTGGLALEFFEDYNPSPLGLYVRAC